MHLPCRPPSYKANASKTMSWRGAMRCTPAYSVITCRDDASASASQAIARYQTSRRAYSTHSLPCSRPLVDARLVCTPGQSCSASLLTLPPMCWQRYARLNVIHSIVSLCGQKPGFRCSPSEYLLPASYAQFFEISESKVSWQLYKYNRSNPTQTAYLPFSQSLSQPHPDQRSRVTKISPF